MVILVPVLYFVAGFVGGLIYAIVFNVAASFTGGLDLKFILDFLPVELSTRGADTPRESPPRFHA